MIIYKHIRGQIGYAATDHTEDDSLLVFSSLNPSTSRHIREGKIRRPKYSDRSRSPHMVVPEPQIRSDPFQGIISP